MEFCNWDRRPAVLFSDRSSGPFEAFALLSPGADWTRCDAGDVFHTAGVMSEPAWRARFEGRFGPLDLDAVMVLHAESAFAEAAE